MSLAGLLQQSSTEDQASLLELIEVSMYASVEILQGYVSSQYLKFFNYQKCSHSATVQEL